MRRAAVILLVLSIAAGIASVIVAATAPNDTTPTDSLWGHFMPTTQSWINLALIAASALLGGAAAFLILGRVRLVAAVAVTSAVGLYFASVVAWRLHAPGSAGNL